MSADQSQPTATARSWHPVSLSIQLAVLVLAEIALFQTYGAHDARFHWAAHFLVAVTTAALVLLAVLLVRGTPGRYPLLLVLSLHLFAMAPDLIFRAGAPHALWMDLFLGHVSVHYLPGGDTAWLVIALVAVGLYIAALTRWLRATRNPM